MRRLLNRLHRYNVERLDEIRIHLARPDALLQLSLLGLVSGLLAGLVIIVFRLLVEQVQDLLLPGDGSENYELLNQLEAFVLPLLAAVAIGLMFRWMGNGLSVLGVARVMERMQYHQGHLTMRGFFLQFFGAALAIIGGHSVGREGPHVFLGAAAGSLMGQYLALPNNAIRTFVACGTAAGIAASFNTPLAGVIFALEVVMLEYTVISFIPVILAAVSATALSNLVFGDTPVFAIPAMQMSSSWELLLVVLLGLAAGAVSAAFVQLLQTIARHTRSIKIEWRVMLAGLFMGFAGLSVPEVMGIGYDSVDAALNAQLGLQMALLLVVAKLLATSVVVGMGVPGGMIGPTLYIGAMLGAVAGYLFELLSLSIETPVGFYALLGMGAMMSASLQAPLAALVAMLELTDNPQIILPGMLAVVVAGITASEFFKKESIFVSMMKVAGQDYDANPVLQTLRRLGVASIMDRRFVELTGSISLQQARQVLTAKKTFILIRQADRLPLVMPAVELAKFMESVAQDPPEQIDLLEMPAQRWQAAGIDFKANCQQAYEQFEDGAFEALYVERIMRFGKRRIYGILSREMVENAYRY